METENEQPKTPGKNGIVVPPAPKGNRYAEKHGLHTLKRAVLVLGKRAIDGRSAVAKALNRWRLELVADLGGADNVSTQKHAIIDLAVKDKFLLDSVDAVLLTMKTLITGPKKAPALIPLVIQRGQLADSLARRLNMLGLERRRKVKSLGELLTDPADDEEPDTAQPELAQ